ncbi:Os01g0271901 [Oryza sativa Japonica Group]|uniref:Os01g0271901 protein n=1 Tax=Oryza sativa subsp. japonica TaxID=39947 RepID=A0A0P0V0U3_ORYSJ|nr:Os01g0271901 [Oryza sativa Japonica Group]
MSELRTGGGLHGRHAVASGDIVDDLARLINDDAKERMPGLLPNKQQHLMLLARAVRVELGRHRAVCRACHAREWTV